MPEGDSLREIARQLSVLVGEHVAVEARNPRAEALAIAPKLDGERLDRVEALGKNLVLTFEGGLVLRSHLRMKGRWRVQPARRAVTGMPWLVIRGREHQAICGTGPFSSSDAPASFASVRRSWRRRQTWSAWSPG